MLLLETFKKQLTRKGNVNNKKKHNVATTLRFLTIFLLVLSSKSSFTEEVVPISNTNAIASEKYSVFIGGNSKNPSSHELYDLHGLKEINNFFYVHARNKIFLVDIPKSVIGKSSKRNFLEKLTVDWEIDAKSYETCLAHHTKMLKNGEIVASDCKNHVMNFIQYNDEKSNIPTNKILACGSNGAKPIMKTYKVEENGSLEEYEERSISLFNERGIKLCSALPKYTTASLSSYGAIYNGFTHDNQISQMFKLVTDDPDKNLKTFAKDPTSNFIRNPAKFARILEGTQESSKILTFFNEPAVESRDNRYMATVAQVCKNDVYKDVGSSNSFQFVFSSFVKVRLNCSIPSNPLLYLDEVVHVSDIVTLETATEGTQEVVFATMKSTSAFINASAVCIFKLDDINNAVESPLMEEVDGFVYPIKNNPYPNISKCDFNVSSSGDRDLNAKSEEFIKSHFMAKDRVQSWNFQKPGPVMLSQKDEYTTILIETVEENEVSISSEKLHYTVMWLGTKSGFLIKTLFLTATDEKIVLERRKVFDSKICGGRKSGVTSLLVNKESGNIFVTFSDCVMAVPLCPHIGLDCERGCKEKKDPYCTWDGHLCQGTTVHDISRDQDLDSSERLAECPNTPIGPIGGDQDNKDTKSGPGDILREDNATKVSKASNESSILVLTSCIGCFIGIVLTSFIFLCCNPCHQLMKKRERHLSAASGLARSNSKRHDSNMSVGGISKPNSLQRGASLQRMKNPSESSSKSYVITTRLSNNENVVMLDATQGRNNSASSGENRNMTENVFKTPNIEEAEKLKGRKISTSSKSGMLVNQIARTPMVNGNMNKVPRQQTLPHPLVSPMAHQQLQRSYSNQQHHGMVARTASFGPQKPPKTLQQIGRQQSFQVPGRPSVGNGEGLMFHPTTPMVVNGNMRGPMTPMAQPTQVMVPMTSSAKGMTYSLDRRQVKRLPHQNSQQSFQTYNGGNRNDENPQRKRYVSESMKPLHPASNDFHPKSTLINYPIMEDPYYVHNPHPTGNRTLKKKMSLDLMGAPTRRTVIGQEGHVGTPTYNQMAEKPMEPRKSFIFQMTPVSTPIEEESLLLSETSTLIGNEQNKSKMMMESDSDECQEVKDALNSVGERSPSSGEYMESVA